MPRHSTGFISGSTMPTQEMPVSSTRHTINLQDIVSVKVHSYRRDRIIWSLASCPRSQHLTIRVIRVVLL